MTRDESWLLICRPVRVVFQTVHWDKAGETSSCYVVDCEIADVNTDGVALLVTADGVHVRLAVGSLFPQHPPETPPESQAYLAGHELIRNFHPAADEPRTTTRSLDRAEIMKLLD